MTFVLADWMLYAMWVVLGLMGVDFLFGVYKMLRAGSYDHALVPGYVKDLLHYVLPLFLLVNITDLDHTGWLIKAGYYIGAAGVALKYLYDMKGKL